MRLQKREQLLLKRFLPMMYFLFLNVSPYAGLLRFADGERRVASLPFKEGQLGKLALAGEWLHLKSCGDFHRLRALFRRQIF